jgi:hypothetical protein
MPLALMSSKWSHVTGGRQLSDCDKGGSAAPFEIARPVYRDVCADLVNRLAIKLPAPCGGGGAGCRRPARSVTGGANNRFCGSQAAG